MNVCELYQRKKTTPEGIAALLKSNMVIGSDIACATPPAIVAALADRAVKDDLHGITMNTSLDLGPMPFYTDPAVAQHIKGVAWFAGGYSRNAIAGGFADFFPSYYYDDNRIVEDYCSYDMVIFTVSPMDKHGYFSFGATASAISSMLKKTKMVCVEVNPNMPRAVNAPFIHISQITALCENDVPLPELPPSQLDDISITIGNIIAAEIPNGATIQLGIGAIPDAVGLALKDKHNLGIHTEMFTSSMVDLIECGAVDNSRKPIHTGSSVTTFAFGSKRIYDFIDDNPAVKLLPVQEVNHPSVIAQHPNFISINAALEVDFFGQVCSESVGSRILSGSGGQVDFVRGAIDSKGGKSFIAFPSTAKGGTISKINPILTPGAVVTTSKNDTDYIVTEYGMAKMRGATVSQRTRNLISIAHPKFRDELIYEAKKRNLII